MEFDLEKFTHNWTTGTCIITEEKSVQRSFCGLVYGSPKIFTADIEVSFDTRDGDDENLSGDWKREYTGTFALSGIRVFTTTDEYNNETYSVLLLILDGHSCIELRSTLVEFCTNEHMLEPEARMLLWETKKKPNGVWFSRIDVTLVFRDKVQISEYLQTLEPESIAIVNLKNAHES